MKININRSYRDNIGRGVLAIALGTFLVGCNTVINHPTQSGEIQIGTDIEPNPLETIQKVLEQAQELNIFDHESENDFEEATKVREISFRELIEYLPQAPRGWTTEEPSGQTNSFGDYRVSQVKQSYTNRHQTMTVSIFDWAFNSALYIPFLFATEFSQESTEGYNKGVEIDRIPGREQYDYHTKNGSLKLLVDRRFLVQIKGENINETELRAWWERCDRHSLMRASSQIVNQ